jgi:histidine triad (HIT) family protein
MKKNCLFCAKIKDSDFQSVIYEDEKVIVVLDKDWVIKGHTLIIWKKHVINGSQLSEKEFNYFTSVLQRIERILLAQLNKDKAVILKSGGHIKHLHFHIYPVSKDASWKEIKQLFDKKNKPNYSSKEKRKLVNQLKKALQ